MSIEAIKEALKALDEADAKLATADENNFIARLIDVKNLTNDFSSKCNVPAIRSLIERLEAAEKAAARHRVERDHSRACYESSIKLLTGIHSLLYPAPTTMPDGRVMVFRPNGLDPHETMQSLSDRIRAIPDELAKSEKQSGGLAEGVNQ